MPKAKKNRASKNVYLSTNQLFLEGFETPFEQKLNPQNRWVILSKKIPWDSLVSVYNKQMHNSELGADGINARVVIGSVMIKHICNFSDQETVMQIQENMYMQYFIGYSSFSNEAPFDSSLFVEIRKRLGLEQINVINELIVKTSIENQQKKSDKLDKNDKDLEKHSDKKSEEKKEEKIQKQDLPPEETHMGKLLLDATACPQDIAYPTDLNLLNDAREKTELIIDVLFDAELHGKKPRTYRKKARKNYLEIAQKKSKTHSDIRKGTGKQLRYLHRNIKHIDKLLDKYEIIPLNKYLYKYLLVIGTFYDQQNEMYEERKHKVSDRIVSIHQPHVRPMVRGKTAAKVEFGSKLHLSLANGYAFIDELSWDAYNEGSYLLSSIEHYKRRTGFYPKEVLADKIYCTRENRAILKALKIHLKAKPLGRPPAVKTEHVSPGERNPIEGKFGQAKSGYGLNRIKARLHNTSTSWIATIVMVLNLVKLAGEVPLWLIRSILTFSARLIFEFAKNSQMRNLEKNLRATYSADPIYG
jgi:hypothetical protein